MADRGIGLPFQPDTAIPELPRDLTDLDDRELMVLFGQFVAWADYIDTELAMAEVDELVVTRKIKKGEARALALAPTGATIAKVKAAFNSQQDTEELLDEQLQRKTYRIVLGTLADNTERDARLVSRELTRRGQFDPVQRRNDRGNP